MQVGAQVEVEVAAAAVVAAEVVAVEVAVVVAVAVGEVVHQSQAIQLRAMEVQDPDQAAVPLLHPQVERKENPLEQK